jgi:predicted ATP-dependent serine protease
MKKTNKTNNNFKVDLNLVKMQDVTFNDDLFIPMKTKTIVDSLLSAEGGVFPGTNTVVIGDPGVGKSTVLLDWLLIYKNKVRKYCSSQVK